MEAMDTIKALVAAAEEAGLQPLVVLVALHIAMDKCDDAEVVKRYGTEATDALRELREDYYAPAGSPS